MSISRQRAVALFDEMGCAQIHDAAAQYCKTIESSLVSRTPGLKMAGPAFPVRTENDMLPCLQALDAASEGDVLVFQNTAETSEALAGDILVTAMKHQGLAGLVVDGAVRDTDTLPALGVPVFSRSVRFVSAKTAQVPAASVPSTVHLGHVPVRPGDWLFGDGDGLILVEEQYLSAVLNAALLLEKKEQAFKSQLAAQQRLGEICGLSAFLNGSGPLRFEP